MAWLRRRRRCTICHADLLYLGPFKLCSHCDLEPCFNPYCSSCKLTVGAGSQALTMLSRLPRPWSVMTKWTMPPVELTEQALEQLEPPADEL